MPVSSESSRNLLDFLNDLEEKVMWQRNNGQAREELKIKFTGYLIQAVRRTQRDYLRALCKYGENEILTEVFCAVSQTLEQESDGAAALWENIESGALLYALKQIDERMSHLIDLKLNNIHRAYFNLIYQALQFYPDFDKRINLSFRRVLKIGRRLFR